ncbi:YopX family protein [Lactiplantibacillus plantarum]|uniref:YopX family protein n=1 Tax=Lactiplantibacillus plantarum TaxID=1590 RepID=UPI0009785D2E|nr:YopX family protein [Lactiplantibacillus plantarum]
MIKFRAWHMPFGKYGAMQEMIYSRASHILALAETEPEKYIPEQFTGLKDVNGKDIYVGDIVHGYDQKPDSDGYIGSSVVDVVNFKYDAFWIGDSWYKIMVMTPPIVEIIGNVHDNPELLEADK